LDIQGVVRVAGEIALLKIAPRTGVGMLLRIKAGRISCSEFRPHVVGTHPIVEWMTPD
jgi:hypothetical protein